MEVFSDSGRLSGPGPYVFPDPARMPAAVRRGRRGFPPAFRPGSVYAAGEIRTEAGDGGEGAGEARRITPGGAVTPDRAESGRGGARPAPEPATEREKGRSPDAELTAEIRRTIRDYPDFPEPGILFRDIAPLLGEPRLLRRIVAVLGEEARRRGAEKIAGIESRGFLLGTPVAMLLDVPFVPVRKQGKLPGATVSIEYQLEYGTAHLEIQSDRIASGERIVVLDDLLATGGTAAAAARLVERLGGIVAGNCFLIELEKLQGRRLLGRYNIFSLIKL